MRCDDVDHPNPISLNPKKKHLSYMSMIARRRSRLAMPVLHIPEGGMASSCSDIALHIATTI